MKTVCNKTCSTQKGIGLLELMLSLAIIAILLIMATRYFNSARTSQKVNETVQLIQTITSASSSLIGSGTPLSNITTANLIAYVPAIYQTNASGATGSIYTPFGTALTIAASPNVASPTGYQETITMAGLPADACTALAGALLNVSVQSNSSGCSSGTYTGIFPI